MEYCKLQIGCLIIVAYIVFIYYFERRKTGFTRKDRMFRILLMLGMTGIVFDGATAYTVNHLQSVPPVVNLFLHGCFLMNLDVIVFLMFFYMLSITTGIPRSWKKQFLIFLPLVVNLLVVLIFLPQLYYIEGRTTNYSMGISAYTCFVMVTIYVLASLVIFVRSFRQLERHKQLSYATYLVVTLAVTVVQSIQPEVLLTSLVTTIVVLSAYLNQENPMYTGLQNYHREMVMGFATLVENRDDSTGGHIHRTTEYVELLAKELKARGFYEEILTRDYIHNLVMAAPMHDVGKIAISDAILQKPGKLTEEEFAIMKTHAARGGEIIRETFGHLGNEQYETIAYDVARYHHEKWNGRGYPDGMQQTEIPLCARIMAIADVFDAVSAKRCYRDAMPLEQCFRIIEEGVGQDFDPIIAEVFLDIRPRIEEVYARFQQSNG